LITRNTYLCCFLIQNTCRMCMRISIKLTCKCQGISRLMNWLLLGYVNYYTKLRNVCRSCYVMSKSKQVHCHGNPHEVFHVSDECSPFEIDLIHTNFLRTAWDNVTGTNTPKYHKFFLTQAVETLVKSVLQLNC
jgi:hypothetical protein